MSIDQLQFRVSAALKNIIGKELITDEYVAVFELVKNSFDAHAKEVKIIFENLKSKNSRIIIKDNGKGMNYEDLLKKWLFVAYSAKKEGVEDLLNDKQDYRNKIHSTRTFAGAKGVGRFSCDRLGSKLNLITIKDDKNSTIENLEVNWEDFEKDANNEFIKVNINHSVLSENPYDIKHGTVLEITGLRDSWDRESILKLKHSLEKLINPNQGNGNNNFAIEIVAKEELHADKEEKDNRNKVNGIINNFLFETLKLKTTEIFTEASADGAIITTILRDRGRLIYKIKERNSFKLLANIQIHLFQLNQSAKLNFSKIMGIPPIQYGSIFLYKNGFRIYPFGEEREDTIGLDRRKIQGHSRFFGTRDLIGRIELNGPQDELKETTSRDGGLVKNESYDELKDFFYQALIRLEKYGIDIIKWGDPLTNELQGALPALTPEDVKNEIWEIIANLAKAKDVIDIEYDKDFFNIMDVAQAHSAPTLLKNFIKIAEKTDNQALQKEVKKAEKQLQSLLVAKNEAEKEAELARKSEKKVHAELKHEKTKNLYLLSSVKQTTPEVLGLIHHIELETDNINTKVERLINKINKGEMDKEKIIRDLSEIKFYSDKTLKISKLVTRSNFNLEAQAQKADIVSYIKEYLSLYGEINENDDPHGFPKIELLGENLRFDYRFSIVEMTILLDNLISNSKKNGAKRIKVLLEKKNKGMQLTFSDDGRGVGEDVKDNIFDLGVTTTNGSGIGLYTVKDILKKMHSEINFIGNGKLLKGAAFQIKFP